MRLGIFETNYASYVQTGLDCKRLLFTARPERAWMTSVKLSWWIRSKISRTLPSGARTPSIYRKLFPLDVATVRDETAARATDSMIDE